MAAEVLFYCFLFLVGLVAGGVVNFCIRCLSKGEEASQGTCSEGSEEGWKRSDRISILSYLSQKGGKFPGGAQDFTQRLIVELVNGVLYITVFMANGFDPMSVLYCLMTSAFLVISIVDERTLEIPLPCNYFVGAVGILTCVLDFANVWEHLIGAGVIFLLLYGLYFFSKGMAIGGGDVKLMAAAGLILGGKLILIAFFLSCVIGSVCHLIRMKVAKAESVLAMGPYLCIGIWICALWGNDLINWYLSFLIF